MIFKCEKSKPSITYINTGNPVRAQRIGMSILDKGHGSFLIFYGTYRNEQTHGP